MSRVFPSSLLWAALGSLGIALVFYVIQVAGMKSFVGPFWFIRDSWYFVFSLIIGFGVQLGLYRAIRLKARFGATVVAASGGVSTSSMIACCVHNFTSLLPILGFSGMAALLASYQSYIFMVSLFFVLGGIIYMGRKYWLLKKNLRSNA